MVLLAAARAAAAASASASPETETVGEVSLASSSDLTMGVTSTELLLGLPKALATLFRIPSPHFEAAGTGLGFVGGAFLGAILVEKDETEFNKRLTKRKKNQNFTNGNMTLIILIIQRKRNEPKIFKFHCMVDFRQTTKTEKDWN